MLPIGVQAMDFPELLELDLRLEAQRVPESRATETDIADPRRAIELYQVDLMRARPGLRPVAVHARKVGPYAEAELLERGKEQSILFETVASARSQQHLLRERSAVETDFLVTEHIYVLVRDALQ